MVAVTDPVPLGRISGCHGLRGWLRLTSYTRPPEALFEQPTWFLCASGRESEDHSARENAEPRQFAETRKSGRHLLGRPNGCTSRDEAEALVGREIVVSRGQLPAAEEGHYYWSDLIGMQVVNTKGEMLGQVDSLFDTGAHDVLEVRALDAPMRLIPWPAVRVAESDPAAGRLTVDWESDF